jgi:glycosyltransferase involved in cell wall biosynthesis
LSPYLDKDVVVRLSDVQFPAFTYLIQDNAYKQRSLWLWTKILADHFLRLSRSIRMLGRVMHDSPVDIVVSNTAAVTLGAVFAKFHRKPHVWCIKECLDPDVTACRKFAKWISRMSSSVVAPSQAVARPFKSLVNIFPDGSDVEAIKSSALRLSRTDILNRLDLPTQMPVVAQVGGVVWWKGQHATMEAVALLASEKIEPSFSLVFLGEGGGAYREGLERQLASLPRSWQSAIRFVGFAPDDFSYVNAADIVIHPSVLPDPFPNAVREAMILGKPVIASDDGGILEMISHGETGILFKTGDAKDLATALARLVDRPDERVKLGNAAQHFSRTQFDIHFRKQAFYNLLQGLVNRSAGTKLVDEGYC